MTTHLDIDAFGRVLIPKKLRESLGVRPGERVEVQLDAGVLHLRPAARPVTTTRHQGRLILQGGPPITGDPVTDLREARTDDLLSRW